jgi:hypothetical protein
MNWYHEQLQQLAGAEIVQAKFHQQSDLSEPITCLTVRKNGKDYALLIWADAEGNAPGWVNLCSRL